APRDVVTVFIPEYVVGHWWEQVLHNQSALRLARRTLLGVGSCGVGSAVMADSGARCGWALMAGFRVFWAVPSGVSGVGPAEWRR
ncbi:hypothetical protein, partial [Nocardia sp. NPDC050413]|uniref:hypothetical protein n=1 Tax=Nocardia sp. NPDC050413 TaxID=3155784 RepID=UPI0033D39586